MEKYIKQELEIAREIKRHEMIKMFFIFRIIRT